MMNTVVLVDDEHFVRKGILALIDWEACGYQVCAEASNGEDALEIIYEKKPDLVITDIRMPVLDGLELIRQLVEERNSSTKFIILSGHNDFEYAQKALRYGVHDFILKPLDKEEIETTLQQLSKLLDEEKKAKEYRDKILALKLFEDMLAGNAANLHKEQLEVLHLDTIPRMNYLIIEINEIPFTTEFIMMDEYKEKINKIVRQLSEIEVVAIRDHDINRFGLLLPDRYLQTFDNSLDKYVGALQKALQEHLKKCITVYVGKTVASINELAASFETANKLLQHKYANSVNKPIMYDLVKDNTINHTEIDDQLYNALIEAIEENDPHQTKEKINTMFQEFRLKTFAANSIKTSLKRCVNKVVKIIKSMEGNEKKLSHLPPMLQLQEYSATLDQLKEVFTAFVLEASKYMIQLRKQYTNSDIHKIKSYIEVNYNQNISLRSIASNFFMNPVYMGQLFKKTYGLYFKEFLLQLRIDESKKLLRQTNLRVYEIAEKVGFKSADYFVTQFEKIENMTPTEYRRSLN